MSHCNICDGSLRCDWCNPRPPNRELDSLKWAIEDCAAHYPEDIFPDPDKDDFTHLHQRRGASERLHGSWARHIVKVIRENAGRKRQELQEDDKYSALEGKEGG